MGGDASATARAELGRSVAAASSTVAASPLHGIVESVAARCPDRNVGAACGPLYWRARSARTRTRERGSRNRGSPYILLDEARQAGTVAVRTRPGGVLTVPIDHRSALALDDELEDFASWHQPSVAATSSRGRQRGKTRRAGPRISRSPLILRHVSPVVGIAARADGLLVAMVQLRVRAGSFGRPNKRGVLR